MLKSVRSCSTIGSTINSRPNSLSAALLPVEPLTGLKADRSTRWRSTYPPVRAQRQVLAGILGPLQAIAARVGRRSSPSPDRAGNSLAVAAAWGRLTSKTRSRSDFVGDADPNDFYSFRLDKPLLLHLKLDQLQADADITLIRDGNGNGQAEADEVLSRSDAYGIRSESISRILPAGTYYLHVSQYLGNTRYRLSLSATPVRAQPNSSPFYGYGLIDAAAAVAKAARSKTVYGSSAAAGLSASLNQDRWSLNAIQAPAAWAQGHTGKGVVVAVVDTGVDYRHPDLKRNIWRNPGEIANNGKDDDRNGYVDDLLGWNFIQNNRRTLDDEGHGTHVAGTIAAAYNGTGTTGVAPDALIMPVKVLDRRGSGTDASVAAGIRYAVNNGADVINLSLGGGYSRAIEHAVRYAYNRGVVVVMAAGNEYDSHPGYPARHANRWGIAVGAVNINRAMANFSNQAAGALRYVVAPGVDIYSTVPGNRYTWHDGTSMATPHVAGVAALVRGANPRLSPLQVAAILTGTANATGIQV